MTSPGAFLPATPEEHREMLGFFPTGVAVITTLDRRGRPQGMTCSSLTSVSVRPSMLLVCLRVGTATADAVRGRGAFAVNLLHERGRRAAEVFSAPLPDRFERVEWRPSWSGLPWLSRDALAIAECRVTRMLVAGDHEVVLAELGRLSLVRDRPLLYGLRRFSVWPEGALADRQAAE